MAIDKQRRALFTLKSSKKAASTFLLPWLKSEEHFLDACTQCGDCIASCPEKIIVKGEAGYPTIDFSLGECTFCEDCAHSCPESLFDTDLEQPWDLSIDINTSCFAKRDIVCQSCADVCDAQAIVFKYENSPISKPNVNAAACTGCGACISTCPASSISIITTEQRSANA